ncbi:ketopantoate reductase [Arthrobacter sp. zg-Y40]|uniref:ketopantoate reductase family protein n=1 Tax=Arthrobacter sp. zg-Y40 TaxID=2886939 RepID=UPI001D1560C1|nr:2-dehydropantoate 2-reductase N-terminal domain-containing protein [Arthrobacter sp. zg-Y40]MCC3278899.1 ketopantoate reductase [Arthrobacter sp. zg-Y40]
MKILMFGRGVIATMYGWALGQAGHEVEFHVRPGRAAHYGDGVELDLLDARRRPWGRRRTGEMPLRFREELTPEDGFDLVVLSVPHYRLAEAAAFLAPRIGSASVLVFGNVWDEPLEAVAALDPERVVWGFPQGGGGFGSDGVLRGTLLATVIFGTFGRPPQERERAVRATFRQSGFRVREQPDFRGWLWTHFVADAGLHAQGLKAGSMAGLVGNRASLRRAMKTSRELLALLQARGVDLRRHRGSVLPFRAPTWLTAAILAWVLAHFPPARANFEAHADPEAQEPKVICRDVLAEARRLGVPATGLAAEELYFIHSGPENP